MKFLKLSSSVIPLIVANLVPLYGAIFAGWNIFSIMILFWLESAIIGFFTIQKMRKAEGTELLGKTNWSMTVNGKPVDYQKYGTNVGKLFFIPFFFVHYGMFMFVHLIFLIIFFGPFSFMGIPNNSTFDFGGVALGFVSLFFSHWLSYQANFIGKGEYKVVSPDQLFLSPYPRIIVMHLTIILGGMLTIMTKHYEVGLALMIVLKIIADVGSHLFEHRQIQKKLL